MPLLVHNQPGSIESLHALIGQAQQLGMPTIARVGCGNKAQLTYELANKHPERLYLGIDPVVGFDTKLKKESDLPPRPPNLILFRGKAVPTLQGTRVGEAHIIAPNGSEDHVRLRQQWRMEEWKECGGESHQHYPDPKYLENDIKGLTIRNADFAFFRQIVSAKFMIVTEEPIYAEKFYALMKALFPTVRLRIFAKNNYKLERHQDSLHLRVRHGSPNKENIFEDSFWPFTDDVEKEHQHQWGGLFGVFGNPTDRIITPLLPRELAPKSWFFDGYDAIFELTGIV